MDDIVFPDMAYLKVVRSRFARARLTRVDGGMTGHELKTILPSVGEGASGQQAVNLSVLSTERVNYVGQPVAAVLGESPYEAEDMAESVDVEYEPLRPVMDPEESLRSEPIHPGTASNVFGAAELGADFEIEAPVVLERRLFNARVAPNPLETRGIVVRYDGSRLTVWLPTQSVHSIRKGMATAMGLPPESVRVVQTDTGGAFGTKSSLYPEYVVAAYAAIKHRRPIKWIETRSEHLVATNQGRGARGSMKVYADRKGRVLGLKADILVDGGAYPVGSGAFTPRFIGYQVTGPYDIRNVFVRTRSAYTNKVPVGPYRGAGRPEAAFFVERMLDMLADELKMDPVDVRLANAASEQITTPLGMKVDPLKPFLEGALEALGYRSKRGHIGFSCFVLVPAAQPGESARLKVADGIVNAWLGGTSHGQEHGVMVKSLLAEHLGVPGDRVRFHGADTDELGEGVGTWGSRGAMMGGMALIEAAKKAKEDVTAKHGSYSADRLLASDLDVKAFYTPSEQHTSLGANLVEVVQDPMRGVRAKECYAYYDVGRPINRAMVESQIIGGSAQAVGQVLYEEARFGEDGQSLTGSIGDAGLPTTMEIPNITVLLAPTKSPLDHGAKGVGESPTIGVPPAMVRAIERLTGREITATPVAQELLF